MVQTHGRHVPQEAAHLQAAHEAEQARAAAHGVQEALSLSLQLHVLAGAGTGHHSSLCLLGSCQQRVPRSLQSLDAWPCIWSTWLVLVGELDLDKPMLVSTPALMWCGLQEKLASLHSLRIAVSSMSKRT